MKSGQALKRCLAWLPFSAREAAPIANRWRRVLRVDQGGFSLVETVVSIAVLSTASVALVGAMSTGYLAYRVMDKQVTAVRLATDQLEKTKAYTPYLPPVAGCTGFPAGNYPAIPVPAGFGITVVDSAVVDDVSTAGVNEARDPCGLERITVTVSYNSKTIKVLQDYKGNR